MDPAEISQSSEEHSELHHLWSALTYHGTMFGCHEAQLQTLSDDSRTLLCRQDRREQWLLHVWLFLIPHSRPAQVLPSFGSLVSRQRNDLRGILGSVVGSCFNARWPSSYRHQGFPLRVPVWHKSSPCSQGGLWTGSQPYRTSNQTFVLIGKASPRR